MRTLYLSIIIISGIVIPMSLLENQIFADNTNTSMATINVQIDKSNSDKPQIMITGTVYKLFSTNLVIVISDPFDQKLAISQLTPDADGHFSETLFAAGPLWIKSGNYSVSVVSSSQQLAEAKFYYDGTKPCCITKGPLHVDSPLKQVKSGIAAKDVTCKENLELILKTKDNSPICVKSDTAITLIKRGWAMSSLKNFGYNPGRGPVSLEPKESGTNDNTTLPKNMSHIIIPPLNDTNSAKPKATSENKNSSLQLFLSIDSEYENPAEPINIDIGLDNTGSVPLTLAKSDNWPRIDMSSGLCSYLPFGISIMKGYYTEQNMSSAKSLVIYENVPCPAPSLIKSYTFEPSSSKATQECDTLFTCPGLTDMKAHLVIPDFMYNDQHHSFDVGNYTLVGGDEWGHVVIQHFAEVYTTAYSTPLEK
ncbi:hypothetical protein DYY66_1666 [Candidatus Nitrosotalea sp. FS]|uniref:hypothetical protein n=1 Tax=Candidatus Nitrosotalea sp. FS TaxID=2341021 RepID=UPI001408ED5C|nr:hypothetical protein [Candidatus Nitrosotalea sp. FS]NHH97165.1 hypothetical protein [Candidatus Nitrosotalea sp. FS]